MLMQIAAPIGSVLASTGEESFRVTDERIAEGTAYLDWEFVLDPDAPVTECTYTGGFTLNQAAGAELMAADGTMLGTYQVTTGGALTVTIDQELYPSQGSGQTEQDQPEGTSVDFPEPAAVAVQTFSGTIIASGAEITPGFIHKLMGLLGVTDTGTDLGDIFTFDALKLGGPNGSEIEDGKAVAIGTDTTVFLAFTWDTEGLVAKAGDWAAIQLPDSFKAMTVTDQPIPVDTDEGQATVGQYSITNGELKFVFDENIEDSEVKNGFVGLSLKFDLTKFNEDVVQEIEFNDLLDKKLTIIAEPTSEVSDIEKIGVPDSSHDAKSITWTVDLANSGESPITAATLTDAIPEGLQLVAASVKGYALTVGLDGGLHPRNEVELDLNTEDGLNVPLPAIAPYKGYRIEYTTTIEDYSKDAFTNSASLAYGAEPLTAAATVDNLTRSNPIEKDGSYNSSTGRIDWTIDVNKSGGKVTGAQVAENLPPGLSVAPGTIEVKKLVKSGNNWTESASDITAAEFPIELGDLGQEDAYRIKFSTEIDYRQVNSGDYQPSNEFNNTAQLKNGSGSELGTAEKMVTVNRDPIIQKTEISNISYTDKKLTWQLEINKARHPLGNVRIVDTLPAGLDITEEENISVYKVNGNDPADGILAGKITIAADSEDSTKTKVTMNLGDIGTDHYQIRYTTEVTDFSKPSFANSAVISGTGIGVGSEWALSSQTIAIADNAYTKVYKGIDYNAKTISWEIKADPKREPVKKLTITDTFPNKGLILLPEDGFAVKLASTPLTEGTDYTLAPYTDPEDGETGYHKGFSLEFADKYETTPLNQMITITYKTSYDPEVVVEGKTLEAHTGEARKYNNQALFTGITANARPISTSANDETTVNSDSWSTGKKEGQLVSFLKGTKQNGWISGAERKIAWQVYINYQKLNQGTGIEVTDTLDYEGVIELDSIKVSVYTVAANGNTTVTATELDKDYYTVTSGGDKTFTLKFKEGFEVKERYVIEFLTTVPDISKANYKNEAAVTGQGLPYSKTISYSSYNKLLQKSASGLSGTDVYTGDELDWEVKINESLSVIKDAQIVDTISAGMEYVKDSLLVYKLVGTEPELQTTGYTLQTAPQDDKTVLTIEFTKDIDAAFVVAYKTVVTATNAQVNNSVEFTGAGIAKQTKTTQQLTARQFSYVGGILDPKKGAIRIIKKDAEEAKVIANNEAQFTLWYELNNVWRQFGDGEFTTDQGLLTIGGLPLREYELREEIPPIGYQGLPAALKILVDKKYDNNEANIINAEVLNTKEKIDITATKVWQNGPEQKPTIWFKLYRQIGSGEATAVPGAGIKELANGATAAVWTDRDKTNIDGDDYTYSVKEVDEFGMDYEPPYYTKTESGLTVTNTYSYVSPKIDITGTKVWQGGPAAKPAIQLQLYRNNEPLEAPVTLNGTEAPAWTHTWTGLDETDSNRVAYEYRIDEVATPVNYGKSISEDGLTVTNTYGSPKTAVTGIKNWIGGPDTGVRPTIELQLYRNGEARLAPVTLINGQLSYTWNDLELTDGVGNNYIYTMDEVEVPVFYTKTAEGLTVTNTYTGAREYTITLKANPSTIVGDGKSTTVLTAKVTDDRGNPAEGVEVVFEAPRGGTLQGDPQVVTNGDGEAKITYRSDKITSTQQEERPVLATVVDNEHALYAIDEIIITFEPAAIIGVVTDDKNNPIEGARVIVTRDNDGDGTPDFRAECFTNERGEYKIAIPEGNVAYDVEIIKKIKLDNENGHEVSFKQKATPGDVNANKYEEFPAEKTFTGVILIKDTDGKNQLAVPKTDEPIIIKQINADDNGKSGNVDGNGVFSIEGLDVGKTYEFVILVEVDGKELLMGNIRVNLSEDGEIQIHEELIDPYGTITDEKGDVLGGVEVELFYANTENNKNHPGVGPDKIGKRVGLPGIDGFAPNNNANPQISTDRTLFNDGANDHGNYAWLVYDGIDYYIIAKKSGYYTYDSRNDRHEWASGKSWIKDGIIHVDETIVPYNFAMTPRDSDRGDGGTITPTPTLPGQPPTTPGTGTPEVPGNPVEPQNPQDSQNPASSQTPTDPSDRPGTPEGGAPGAGDNQGTGETPADGKGTLPKTGESGNSGYYTLGMLFIALGLYLGRRRTA